MEQVIVQQKREWPKFYWGPDLRQARFDSPADVPRDYFPTLAEAQAYVNKGPHVGAPMLNREHQVVHLTEPAAVSASVEEMEEFRKWQAAKARMAKARAARKPREPKVGAGTES